MLSSKDEAPRRYTALRVLANWLLGKAPLTELVQYVEGLGLLENIRNLDVTTSKEAAMSSLCEQMNIQAPGTFTLNPLNSPAGLFHLRVLLILLSMLNSKNQQRFFEQFRSPACPKAEAKEPQFLVTLGDTSSGQRVADAEGHNTERSVAADVTLQLPEVFDSHFHLDRTRKHFNLSANASLSTVLQQTPAPLGSQVNLVGSVAVFCDPRTYPSPSTIRT